MAFTNRVRLPIKLHKPQFPQEREVYRMANGATKTLSVIIRKVYDGQTDDMPEKMHERLVVALGHDNVVIEGDKYIGAITLEGNNYDIEWSDFLSRPVAQAKFKANVTPFNATNSNCGTCEEYSQVIAEDDNLGDIPEDSIQVVDILANDSICCYPITVSIITFNTSFVDSVVVNPDNTVTIEIKDNLPSANSVMLGTYRVQCDNGIYDEANIIANIQGTSPDPVCLAPTDPQLDSLDSDTSATFSWTAPSPVPDCGYHWEVRTPFSVVLASGDVAGTSVTVTGLPSNENFLRFFVRSNCCDAFESNYAGPVIFSLPPPSDTETCGEYELTNENLFFWRSASYIDCNGDEQTIIVPQAETRSICALQTSPGNPVQINAMSELTVTYIGLC